MTPCGAPSRTRCGPGQRSSTERSAASSSPRPFTVTFRAPVWASRCRAGSADRLRRDRDSARQSSLGHQRGNFALQQFGTLRDGSQTLHHEVVPGSGTDGLNAAMGTPHLDLGVELAGLVLPDGADLGVADLVVRHRRSPSWVRGELRACRSRTAADPTGWQRRGFSWCRPGRGRMLTCRATARSRKSLAASPKASPQCELRGAGLRQGR